MNEAKNFDQESLRIASKIYEKVVNADIKQLKELHRSVDAHIKSAINLDVIGYCSMCGADCLGTYENNEYPYLPRNSKFGTRVFAVNGTLCLKCLHMVVEREIISFVYGRRKAVKWPWNKKKVKKENKKGLKTHIYYEVLKLKKLKNPEV